MLCSFFRVRKQASKLLRRLNWKFKVQSFLFITLLVVVMAVAVECSVCPQTNRSACCCCCCFWGDIIIIITKLCRHYKTSAHKHTISADLQNCRAFLPVSLSLSLSLSPTFFIPILPEYTSFFGGGACCLAAAAAKTRTCLHCLVPTLVNEAGQNFGGGH